jgi:tricorn protease
MRPKNVVRTLVLGCLAFAVDSIPSIAAARPRLGIIRDPDVSRSQIVFVYAGDLWLVPRDGGRAAPLTRAPGRKSNPRFSPDGRTIAFTGDHGGIYTIPVTGGTPARVTHHPGTTTLCSWTPEGRLLYMTDAFLHVFDGDDQARVRQLFTVAAAGGLPRRLPVPYGADGEISADGRWLAYTPYAEGQTEARKHYLGGFAPDVWLFNLRTSEAKRMTTWEGADNRPMWHGETVYYVSDAGPEGTLNLWSYDTKSSRRRQVTHVADYDVKWPSIGPGRNGEGEIVYVSGTETFLLDPRTGTSRRVDISLPAEVLEAEPRPADAARSIVQWNLSPDGRQSVLEARGDIWIMSNDTGALRSLVKSSGAAERDPAWSPDGTSIAFFSDAGGEYQLYVADAEGRAPPRQASRLGDGFRYRPVWSPDSRRIAFHDGTGSLYLHTIETGETKSIDRDPFVRPPQVSWSPDSRWLAYARGGTGNRRYSAIWLYDSREDRTHQVTGGAFNDTWPTFDTTGDYLYFVSARSFTAPKFDSVDYNNFVYPSADVLLIVPLRDDLGAPWLPATGGPARGGEIALEGFEHRALPALRDHGKYGNLAASLDGRLLFSFTAPDGTSAIKLLDLKQDRKAKTVLTDLGDFKVSAGGAKLLVRQGKGFAVVEAAPDQKIDKPIERGAMTVEVDPRAERRQIFDDAWRFYRDFLYDEKMRGVDWPAVRGRYAKLLDGCGNGEDLYQVLREMVGELGVSHAFVFAPGRDGPPPENTGMLAVDFEVHDGAYRIARIYEGAASDPLARNFLRRSGVNVREGDHLLAVNDVPLDIGRDPWIAFKGLAGKTATLTVGSKPVKDREAREVTVAFSGGENYLRNKAWAEANRARVEARSQGRLGSQEFSRQLNSQLDKDALIIDARWNEGGHVPLHIIEILTRTPVMYWQDLRRGAPPGRTPDYLHHGPKCLLINGVAYSGADGLAYLFRQKRLGKLIGTKTMGGMLGAGLINVPFVDGGGALVPHVGFLNERREWIVEGSGVAPDVEVIDDPGLMTDGRDPQLDAAIDTLLGEIDRRPSP